MTDIPPEFSGSIAPRDFTHIKVGDRVVRQMGLHGDGSPGPRMALPVTKVDDELIYCGPHGWTFDRATGFEVDHDLQWGPMYGTTGTFLIGVVKR